MFDPSRFRLLQALILSLLVHAAVLLGVAKVLSVRLAVPAATINVVFSTDARQMTARTDLAAEPKAPASAAAPRPLLQPRPARRQLMVDNSPLLASVPTSSQATPAEPSAALPLAADSAIAPTSQQTGIAGSAPSLSRDAVSADDLRQYRISLAIAARRFKHYPAIARERGWEGTVEVALTVRAHLPEPEVILVRSSGHLALDRQAQEMMTQAARTIILPVSLQGRDLRLLLPVQFSLEGAQ